MLTLRPKGLSSPAYRDWLDYVIVEDGRDVGRLYEDRLSRPELRWFWSITVYVNSKLGITTSGRARPTRLAVSRRFRLQSDTDRPGGESYLRDRPARKNLSSSTKRRDHRHREHPPPQ